VSQAPGIVDLDELERRVDAHLELIRLGEVVRQNRVKVLAQPIPRNTCPGCFMAIYDGAAEQGWCCDCHPKRAEYEKGAKP
jgi:ribosomal protein L37AE/L43A